MDTTTNTSPAVEPVRWLSNVSGTRQAHIVGGTPEEVRASALALATTWGCAVRIHYGEQGHNPTPTEWVEPPCESSLDCDGRCDRHEAMSYEPSIRNGGPQ